jgi:AcrR family transcriptional regulator
MRLKDDHKEQLIRKKAIGIIVEQGFDGLSMQKLAKAVGISVSTIYVYFKNREDLLNQLFIEVEQTFEEDALRNFDPEMSFEKGLWLQWKNRCQNIVNSPVSYRFFEQFRNSPLIRQHASRRNHFRKSMNLFVQNAISNKEIIELPVDVFWVMAYGPFYALINFHLNQSTMAGKSFSLSEPKMKDVFRLVVKALKR